MATPDCNRVRRAAFLVAVFGLVASSAFVARAGTTGHRVLTVYSVATGLQYINSTDDSARGKVNNPLTSTENRLNPKGSGRPNGPNAGDIALYALKLYSSPTLKRPAGSAVYTCYFNYNGHALCQAYYKLKTGSTIVASGPVDFNKSGFTIVVTGGTTKYLGVRGEAKVVAAPHNAQRIDFELNGAAASETAQTSHRHRVYAAPRTVQFMNHADDRLRGMATNPFKLKSEAVILNDNGKEKGQGPFPGDDILYTFKLFADAKLAKPIGTALFTCYYAFGKRATCDAYFDLPKGLVLASGLVRFGQSHFTLGTTGGTRAYFGALGQVDAVATADNTQRFDLLLTGTRK